MNNETFKPSISEHSLLTLERHELWRSYEYQRTINYKPIIERYKLDQGRHKHTVIVQFGAMHADTEARESEGVGQH